MTGLRILGHVGAINGFRLECCCVIHCKCCCHFGSTQSTVIIITCRLVALASWLASMCAIACSWNSEFRAALAQGKHESLEGVPGATGASVKLDSVSVNAQPGGKLP